MRRSSTGPGSTSADARMHRRTTSGVSLTEVVSTADAGRALRSSGPALESAAVAPDDVRRPNRTNAPAMRATRQVAVTGTGLSVGARHALGRETIHLRRDTSLVVGLAVVCRTQGRRSGARS